MKNASKIKILDDVERREEISQISQSATQKVMAKWAVALAIHISEQANYDFRSLKVLTDAIHVVSSWQVDQANVYAVRRAALRVHQLARNTENAITTTILRSFAHAISTGHMSEHALVASDYAIKAVGLLTLQDMQAIETERLWQVQELIHLVEIAK